MKTKIYYLFLIMTAFLMLSCEKSTAARIKKDAVLEYDVIEIDSCEYLMVQSSTSYGYIVTSIGHKGNCKYCKERRSND